MWTVPCSDSNTQGTASPDRSRDSAQRVGSRVPLPNGHVTPYIVPSSRTDRRRLPLGLSVNDVAGEIDDIADGQGIGLALGLSVGHQCTQRRFDSTVDVGEGARVAGKPEAVDRVENLWNGEMRQADS